MVPKHDFNASFAQGNAAIKEMKKKRQTTMKTRKTSVIML